MLDQTNVITPKLESQFCSHLDPGEIETSPSGCTQNTRERWTYIPLLSLSREKAGVGSFLPIIPHCAMGMGLCLGRHEFPYPVSGWPGGAGTSQLASGSLTKVPGSCVKSASVAGGGVFLFCHLVDISVRTSISETTEPHRRCRYRRKLLCCCLFCCVTIHSPTQSDKRRSIPGVQRLRV